MELTRIKYIEIQNVLRKLYWQKCLLPTLWGLWDIKRHSPGSWPRNLLNALFKGIKESDAKEKFPEITIDWTELKLSQRTVPIPKVQDSGNICSSRSQNCCRLLCLFFFAFWVRDYPALVPPSYVGCMGWEGCGLSSFPDAVAPGPGWAWCPAKNGLMGIFWREIEFSFPYGEMKWVNTCVQKEA